MGNQNYKARLLSAIEKGRHDRIREILKAAPQVLEEDVSEQMRVTPLARAVWRGDFETVSLLIELGANVNNAGTEGITPLMWAARRDNAYMVSNLIDMGADLLPQSNEGFTALDYAVVHGNYRPALFLYDFMDQLKGHLDYYQFGKDRDYRYVNYEMFLTHLKAKTQYQQVPNFFQRPEKKKLLDPVIDPREPWGKMISRIVEFEDPPLVERSELPNQLQPQNRFWGKVRSQLNGIDPTPRLQQHEKEEVIGLNEQQPKQSASSHVSPQQGRMNQVVAHEDSMIQEQVGVNHISIE